MEYSNVRIKDFVTTNDYSEDSINRNNTPRMPWHDVAIQVKGMIVSDISYHFRDRWNFMVKDTLSQIESLPAIDVPVLHLDYEVLDPTLEEHQSIRKIVEETYRDINDPNLTYTDVLTNEQDSCECQLVISACPWSLGIEETEHSIQNAYIELIQNSEYFIYIENQYFISSTAGNFIVNKITDALTQRIIRAHSENKRFKVIILLPLIPAYEGELDLYNFTTTSIKQIMHWQYKTINRESETSIFDSLIKHNINPSDYINFFSLRTHEVLKSGPVTELVYIHSKILIVDDKSVIIGSANINDRSMAGNRDSEVALVIRNGDFISRRINGDLHDVSEFAHKLRIELCMEHLGIDEKEIVEDPLSTEFTDVWSNTARVNTEMYRKVFRCYPDDNISSIREIQEFKQEKQIEAYPELVSLVKGNLVEYPLRFLSGEKLKKTDYLPNIVLKDELYT